MLIQKILLELLNKKLVFTDLNVRAGEIVKIRTPSGWGRFGNEPVAREEINSFLTVIAGANWLNRLQNSPTQSLDIAKTIGGAARLRCNIAFSGSLDENEDHQIIDDVTISIRKLSLVPIEYADIGLPAKLLQEMINRKGLWLVTGPTGNGKSTTLASILQYINTNQSKHIITIEHPIEYILRPSRCIISQKEVELHTPSFNAGLVAALRQRPDYLMIGEVRDKETMETMLSAAESGHAVFATLHTKNTADAISKCAAFLQGPTGSSKLNTFSSVLCGVVAQTLVPSADGKELVLAYEILLNNPEIQNIIRKEEYQKISNALSTSKQQGCIPLNDCLKDLLMRKKITEATALQASYEPESLKKERYL